MFYKLLLTVGLLTATIGLRAAQLTATLQSGDKMTPFYGENAFVDAYTAAVDGDVITLSAGVFTPTDIAKSVTVVGADGLSEDVAKLTKLGTTSTMMTISADNVTLEGLWVYKIQIKATENLTIKCSCVNTIVNAQTETKKYHNNTTVIDTMIEEYGAMNLSKNTILRKCAIHFFSNINDASNLALIENCYITRFASTRGVAGRPYAIYRNCILRLYNTVSYSPILSLNSPSEFHNNFFWKVDYFSSTSSYADQYKIDFGTAINKGNTSFESYSVTEEPSLAFYYRDGRYGTIGHKDYPSIPVITSSEIDTETDADGKINVKISAEARD